MRDEVMYRREQQWKVFSWVSSLYLAIIGGVIVISSNDSPQGAWRLFPHNRQSPLRPRCRVDEGRSKKVAGRRELLTADFGVVDPHRMMHTHTVRPKGLLNHSYMHGAVGQYQRNTL
jgi:hypothetical protein